MHRLGHGNASRGNRVCDVDENPDCDDDDGTISFRDTLSTERRARTGRRRDRCQEHRLRIDEETKR